MNATHEGTREHVGSGKPRLRPQLQDNGLDPCEDKAGKNTLADLRKDEDPTQTAPRALTVTTTVPVLFRIALAMRTLHKSFDFPNKLASRCS